jgi:hypothetical protein
MKNTTNATMSQPSTFLTVTYDSPSSP